MEDVRVRHFFSEYSAEVNIRTRLSRDPNPYAVAYTHYELPKGCYEPTKRWTERVTKPICKSEVCCITAD